MFINTDVFFFRGFAISSDGYFYVVTVTQTVFNGKNRKIGFYEHLTVYELHVEIIIFYKNKLIKILQSLSRTAKGKLDKLILANNKITNDKPS